VRSSKQSSNRTFSLIHDILNDIDLGYPERISDFQASDIPVIDQVIGKMAAGKAAIPDTSPVLRTPSYITRCSVLRLSFCFLLHLCFWDNTLYRKSRLISLGNQAAVYRIFIFGTKSDHPHGDNVCVAVDCAQCLPKADDRACPSRHRGLVEQLECTHDLCGRIDAFFDLDGVQLTVALHNQVDLVAVLVPVIMQQTILGTVAVGLDDFRHNIVF